MAAHHLDAPHRAGWRPVFGPYTSAGSAYKALNLLNRLFPYRKCEKKITGHDEVCLYYHIKQCLAPCIGETSHEEYLQAIENAALFLNGRGDEILRPLEEEMQQAADAWNFERAAEVRDRIDAVKHVLQRQKVVSADNTNADVIAVAQGTGGDAGVQVSFLRNGKLLWVRVLPDERSYRGRARPSDQRFRVPVLRRSRADSLAAWSCNMPCPRPMRAVDRPNGCASGAAARSRSSFRSGASERALVEMVAKIANDNLEQNRVKFLSDEMRMTAALDELSDALDLPRLHAGSNASTSRIFRAPTGRQHGGVRGRPSGQKGIPAIHYQDRPRSRTTSR